MDTVDLAQAVASLTPIEHRGPDTTEDEVRDAFVTLASGDFRDCGVYLGSFDGNAGWERHVTGDELLHVIAGSSELDIIVDDEIRTLELTAGTIVVVPRSCWHRFRSTGGVTVLSATPRSDEQHTFVDDPRHI